MPRLTQTISHEVVRYREFLAVLRDCEKQEIDASVWKEYMNQHPIENEPNYSELKKTFDHADPDDMVETLNKEEADEQ